MADDERRLATTRATVATLKVDGHPTGAYRAAVLPLPIRGCPWSPLERDVLDQVRRVLSEQMQDIEFGEGATDEGDPWIGFYDATDGALVVHIARIDVAYVLIRAAGTSVRTASLIRLLKAVSRGNAHAAVRDRPNE